MFLNALMVPDILDPQLASLGKNLLHRPSESSAVRCEPATVMFVWIIISLGNAPIHGDNCFDLVRFSRPHA